MSKRFNTPVLLIAFNRPGLTRQVLRQIAKVRPEKLYFAVDGARTKQEISIVEQVKNVIKEVDWPCQVKTRFQTQNLGCKYGPVHAMDWFFQNEEMGIILEDDVLADPSFFYFSEQLLKKYQNDLRVGSISGNNFQFGRKNNEFSYYFSRYSHSCGWATWRRAWKKYDIHIAKWPDQKSSGALLNGVFTKKLDRFYWTLIFDGVHSQELDTAWDYQWNYMMWSNNMLGVIPNQNLVSNIGFGVPGATHTKIKSKFSQIPIVPMNFPLSHPPIVQADRVADDRTQRTVYVLWKEILMGRYRRFKVVQRILFGGK